MKKLEDCIKVTSRCLEKAKAKNGKGRLLLKWATDYYKDSLYYSSKDPETALEAVSYAHGFIDSGVLLGHLEIPDYHLKKETKGFK